MKLEVGMYVRTKRDGIGKIISLSIGEEDECCFIELSKRRTGIKEHNILKASHNIIDLIEVGDYVNGFKITTSDENGRWVYAEDNNGYLIQAFSKDNVESIVTKEQFEQMQYKVGE